MRAAFNPFRLSDSEFEPLKEEFFSIVGRDFFRRKAAAHFRSHLSHGSINQSSLLHLGLYHALEKLSAGEVRSVLDQSVFGGAWFLIKFVVWAHRQLDDFGRRRLAGMLRDGLGTNGNLHRLLSELLVYFDYQWLGLSPCFVDLNGLGDHDMVVRDGDEIINVEVKTLSLSSGEPWPERLVRKVAAQLHQVIRTSEYADGDLFTVILLGRSPDTRSVMRQLTSLTSIVSSGEKRVHLPDLVFLKGKAQAEEIEELEALKGDPSASFNSSVFGGNNPALGVVERSGAKAVLRVRFNEQRLFGKAAAATLKKAVAQLPREQLGVVHLHLIDAPSFEFMPEDFQRLAFFQNITAAFVDATRGRKNIASLTVGGMLNTSLSQSREELIIGGRMSGQIPNPESYDNAVKYRDRVLHLTHARRG